MKRRRALPDKAAREHRGRDFRRGSGFRGDTPPNDDMTAVAVKITA